MSQEKRRYIRWKEKIKVAYAFAENESYKEVFTEDLSEAGLQILTTDRLELEQAVMLKIIFIYDPLPIIAIAKVVHAENKEGRYKIGLEFFNMNDFEKQRLRRNLIKAKT